MRDMIVNRAGCMSVCICNPYWNAFLCMPTHRRESTCVWLFYSMEMEMEPSVYNFVSFQKCFFSSKDFLVSLVSIWNFNDLTMWWFWLSLSLSPSTDCFLINVHFHVVNASICVRFIIDFYFSILSNFQLNKRNFNFSILSDSLIDRNAFGRHVHTKNTHEKNTRNWFYHFMFVWSNKFNVSTTLFGFFHLILVCFVFLSIYSWAANFRALPLG